MIEKLEMNGRLLNILLNKLDIKIDYELVLGCSANKSGSKAQHGAAAHFTFITFSLNS